MANVCPAAANYITHQDLLDMGIHPRGVEVVWSLFDKVRSVLLAH
jgi:hypothetical protein